MSDKPEVIITGASRGIGRAIAEKMSQEGWKTFETASSVDSFTVPPAKHAVRFGADLSDPGCVSDLIENFDTHAGIVGCVCNAGINLVGDIVDYAEADLRTMLEVNLASVIRIAQASARPMIRGGKGGSIIFISSIWGERARAGRAVYSATKAGLLGFMRGMAVDLAPHGIRVNAVSPGFTETALTRQTNTPEELRQITDAVPMKRLARPDEIAEVAAFLLSSKASYITGQNLVVDGGFSIV